MPTKRQKLGGKRDVVDAEAGFSFGGVSLSNTVILSALVRASGVNFDWQRGKPKITAGIEISVCDNRQAEKNFANFEMKRKFVRRLTALEKKSSLCCFCRWKLLLLKCGSEFGGEFKGKLIKKSIDLLSVEVRSEFPRLSDEKAFTA